MCTICPHCGFERVATPTWLFAEWLLDWNATKWNKPSASLHSFPLLSTASSFTEPVSLAEHRRALLFYLFFNLQCRRWYLAAVQCKHSSSLSSTKCYTHINNKVSQIGSIVMLITAIVYSAGTLWTSICRCSLAKHVIVWRFSQNCFSGVWVRVLFSCGNKI